MKTQPTSPTLMKGIVRESMKTEGFFDGRYRTRKAKDKKKEQSRTMCRKRIEY